MSNPAQLPAVLAAIAWEEIPQAVKGPLIDQVLRACLTAAWTVEMPNPPGVSTGTIFKHVAIGALGRAPSYPTGIKVRIADRMAQIILRPSPDFAIGFLSGLVSGLWDGLTGPFVLLWDLVKIGYEIQAAQVRLIATLANRQSREALTRDVRAAPDRVDAQVSCVRTLLLRPGGCYLPARTPPAMSSPMPQPHVGLPHKPLGDNNHGAQPPVHRRTDRGPARHTQPQHRLI
jgi:hypothetical protein